MTPQQLHTREEIVKEANKLAFCYDRIMKLINRCESEKRSLKALKKLRMALETFEVQNQSLGQLN